MSAKPDAPLSLSAVLEDEYRLLHGLLPSDYPAHDAESGGATAVLKRMFTGLPPESFADAMQKSGVSPTSLAAGYVTFFLYSTAIGMVAIVLTFIVKRQQAGVGRLR